VRRLAVRSVACNSIQWWSRGTLSQTKRHPATLQPPPQSWRADRRAARAQSAAQRQHEHSCGDPAEWAERPSTPTAGCLDLPSFGATVDHRSGACGRRSLGAAAWVERARPRGGGRAKGFGFKMARRAGRLSFCLPPPGTQGHRRLAQRRRAGRWAPDFESVRPRPCGARVKYRVWDGSVGAPYGTVCGRFKVLVECMYKVVPGAAGRHRRHHCLRLFSSRVVLAARTVATIPSPVHSSKALGLVS